MYAGSKTSELTTRVPQAVDLLMLATPNIANYKAAVSTFGKVYYPEWYGAAGDGVTDDSVAIQAAIDAAGAAGGGTVMLAQTYLVSRQGITDLAFYIDVDYALWVPYSNVSIVGPGTITMDTAPVTTMNRFVVIIFGTGGSSDRSIPYEVGDWCENNQCVGVTFDMSGLSLAEREAINDNPSGIIEFAYCKHFLIAHNTIIEAFGYGPINTLPSSKLGAIVSNRILGACRAGMWLDGLRGTLVQGNVIAGDIWGITDSIASNGIAILANSDNLTNSGHNVITGNILINCKGGAISSTGIFQHITDNIIYHTTGGGTAIKLNYSSNVTGDYPSTGSVVANNRIYHTINLPTAIGVQVSGKTVAYDGRTVTQEGWTIEGNIINSNWGIAVDLDEEAKNGRIINNYLGGDIVEDPTATGNIIQDNAGGALTENTGLGTVASGTTSIVVPHGLRATPTRVNITPAENPTNPVTYWWVDTIGATNFTINVNADPGASNLDFFWEAKVR